MKQYPAYKSLDLTRIANEINDFWKENDTFIKSVQNRKESPTFTFYEGPPSANGEPGIHHVISRTIKDIFCRYKTMQGYEVIRKSGWDTHGLPVELQVEKSLGITKEEIGKKISIQAYNAECKKTVMRYTDSWQKLTKQMGYWLDTENPYTTFDNAYIESVWYLLKQFYNKGLLYKGYSIQPYSPAAGTGLSSHELNQPGCYRFVKDTTIVAQFKVKNTEQVYIAAWTTTPWTLPANSALAVGENITYVKVRTYNPYTGLPIQIILAESALSRYFTTPSNAKELDSYQLGQSDLPWEIIDRYIGKDLIGLEYDQLLPYVQPQNHIFKVVAGDFVTTEEGTGIVHIAPTFGSDDMRLAQKLQIDPITVTRDNKQVPIVDKQGRFVEEITDWAGKYVKEDYEPEEIRKTAGYKPVDVLIAIQLKQDNKAFQVAKYEHNYPHCWRTDKPILYYPLEAWFIKTTAYKEKLIALNKTINWKPSSTGTGRFENWLENLVDWNLSRDRFWGTPLPIWQTEDKQEETCIGSIQELQEEVTKSLQAGYMQQPLPNDFDLHKPYVDEVILVSKNGKKMHRIPDLIDVWFDSGAMPYAQWHYPFKNKETFEKHFPADFIAEGVDQTRGWFFTLHTIAGMLFNSVAFKNVISNGLVLDKNGNKMSKRLGNTIDPFKTLQQHGTDAVRWYIISNANPWDNLKFDPEGPTEVARKLFSTLHNTYNFFALYANLDKFYFNELDLVPLTLRPNIDRWIISRLHSLVKLVSTTLDDYEPTKAARDIQDFVVEELSNWYVRLNRKRFWKSESSTDKVAAYQTLYSCLRTIAQLAAPIAPFYTDRLYQDLATSLVHDNNMSVHISNWPIPDETYIDLALEHKMQQAQIIVSLVHSLRKKYNLKVRQPLSKIMLPINYAIQQAEIETFANLILAETNVKSIVYIPNTSKLVSKKVKLNFKSLRQTYKPYIKELTDQLVDLNQTAIITFENQKQLNLIVKEQDLLLSLEEVIITSEDIPGWSVANQGDITVALDISLTEELKQEGLARELVNRIQNIRKNIELDVQDKITLTIAYEEEFVKESVLLYKNYICQETQAITLEWNKDFTTGEKLEIDDYIVWIGVRLHNLIA